MRKQLIILAAALVSLAILVHVVPPAYGQPGFPALPGIFVDIATPSNPSAGTTRVYTKNGTACALSPLGVETCTGSGGGGGTITINNVSCATGGSCVPLFNWNPVLVAPPAAASWTVVTGGSIADVTGGVGLRSSTSNQLTFAWVANPGSLGSAFTIYAHMNSVCPGGTANNQGYGIGVGDSGAKIVQFSYGLITSGGANVPLQVNNWTNSSTFSTTQVSTGGLTPTPDLWWKLQYDTTPNLTWSVSGSGSNSGSNQGWVQLEQVSATAFLASAPAKLGFIAYPGTSGFVCGVVLDHWNVTQP